MPSTYCSKSWRSSDTVTPQAFHTRRRGVPIGERMTGCEIDKTAAADKKKGDSAADKARRDQAAGQALGVFCQSLLASNQFLYID